MTTINTDSLSMRDTKACNDVTVGTPVWSQEDVVIAYKNAFGERICGLFEVSFLHSQQGPVLVADGITTLEWFVSSEWEKQDNVPFEVYDGRYDSLPVAGLAPDGLGMLTHAANMQAADDIQRQFDEAL